MFERVFGAFLGLARQHWPVVLGLGLALYFGYHAVSGSRGLLAWRQLSWQLEATERELASLREERRTLEHKVGRLRDHSLDRDLIDELARRQLSLVDPLDVIILLDEDLDTR